MRPLRSFLVIFGVLAGALLAQPADAPIYPLDDLKPGMTGEVWTVFQGTQAEPFAVKITGVLRNTLGPGKSLIVCELTDERVQKMGAVAGMSGSPLYVEGRLAGALSYQIQRFETVRFAGFTPASDLAEVNERSSNGPADIIASAPSEGSFKSMQPVFTLGGLSPTVADLFAPRFNALGLGATMLGGSTQSSTMTTGPEAAVAAAALRPGSAVGVALATGDITLSGTGTVSMVHGNRITAFGHPMLSLGDVALPMCAAEIVTILPSQMQSVKMANTGAVIGTITQDRLSAVSGILGAGPAMTDVEVQVKGNAGSTRTLRFSVARQQQLTPALVAAGVSQAILGSNDSGLANGFRVSSDVSFPADQRLAFQTLYSGPQGFTQGLNEFVQGLTANLQNPYEKTFPNHVTFTVEALDENPSVTLDQFQLSRSTARPGEKIQATIAWRNWQGEAHSETVEFTVDSAWVGKQLEVVLAPGRTLDGMTGRPRVISASELRSFEAYLAAMRDERPTDGLCLAVVEKTSLFSDQTVTTAEAPGSIERIARSSDEARFRKRDALLPLWEHHLLDGKLTNTVLRRPLNVVD